MADGGVLNAFTPVVNAVSRLTSVLPGADVPKVTSDQAADVIAAKDTKHDVAHDRQSPMWARLLRHGAEGAVAGGLGLGTKAGIIAGGVTGHPWKGVTWGAGIGAAVGGGAAVANELFHRATEKRRTELADKTLDEANPHLLKRLKDPDVAGEAETYNQSRQAPIRGLELGALLGGMGGGVVGAYSHGTPNERESHAGTGALIGMAGLGSAGLLLGALLKRHRRNQLVEALTKKGAAHDLWLKTNEPDFQTATGGNPRKASNRQLMKAMAGPPERYAAGVIVSGDLKLAAVGARVKLAREAGLEKAFLKDITTGGGKTYKVYTVNGPYVRNHIDVGFIGGSNPEADPKYIPEGEIWLDNTLEGMDRDAILVHEKTEAVLMSEDDREYHDAHGKANEVEEQYRDDRQDKPLTEKRVKEASWARPMHVWFGYEPPKLAAETAQVPRLRSRSEVVIYSDKGVFCSLRDDYILFPGGGIDDGETPELAVAREAIEEGDRKVLHLKAMGTSEKMGTYKKDPKFDGDRTFHFIALDGGEIGTKHEDHEDFQWIEFGHALRFLADCMKRDEWNDQAANEIRRQSIIEAQDAVEAGHIHPVKLARLNIDVPAQLDDHSCGPACVAGIRIFRGERTLPQQKLAAALDTDVTKGTHPVKISEAIGLVGTEGWSDQQLKTALDAGHPVLMLCKDASADDHYVVAVGYDAHGVSVDDPAEPADRTIPWSKLASVWKSDSIETLSRYGWEVTPALSATNLQKTADALNLIDRPEYVLFNPQGQIMVGNDEGGRIKLPNTGTGAAAPYEPTLRHLPPLGAPEAGVHGYNVHFNVGDAAEAPGFEGTWQDPHLVLRGLYGAMGRPANAPYRELDRARARVILRAMKKRTKAPAAPVVPVPVTA